MAPSALAVSSITIPPATAVAPFPSKPPATTEHDSTGISRRRTAAYLVSVITAPLILSFPRPPTAAAFSLGISGPKEWLKEQKRKSSKYLLAPVDASRKSLRSAFLLLTKGENTDYGENDIDEVKKLITSASRDCVAEDWNPFVAFQAKTGVEVCTFRLIAKNAASLLDDKDPAKLEAEAKLSDLIRSLDSLRDIANEINIQVASNRLKVADALLEALHSLDNFEQGIKNCLDI